jgi:hypothetical protein
VAASLLDEVGNVVALAGLLTSATCNVGLAALLDGDIGTARRALQEELRLSREPVVPLVVGEGLRALAALAAIVDDLARAARLVGAAANHTYERVDDDGIHARLNTTHFGPARGRYGEAARDAARAAGAALSLPDAIAYALDEPRAPR